MRELTLKAAVENIEAVTEFVTAVLEEADCPMKAQMQISIAIDEIFSNIAYYAYAPGTGDATVTVEITQEPAAVVTFIDKGTPYDPLESADPDTSLSAEERAVGGLGIFMVKKSMDEVTYAYQNGCNTLTIKKKF